MFEALQPDYTSSFVVGSILAVTLAAIVVTAIKTKEFGLWLFAGMCLFVAIFAFLASAAITDINVRQDNFENLETFFEEEYTGDFTILAHSSNVNTESFADVEEQRITVERKLDDAIYIYRLTAGEDETQPALLEIVSGERTNYPPLKK